MYIYLSKILPLFVMPLGIALLLILISLVVLLRGHAKTATVILTISVALLSVSSMPIVAQGLYRQLESRFPPQDLQQTPVADCIVMLGGVATPGLPPRTDVDFSGAIDRIFKTAELYRSGKGRVVIVSAGNQPWSNAERSEADVIRDVLVEWGVAQNSIITESSSRNTRENAVYSKHAIDAIGCREPLLVTSAAHMPRAVAAFEAVGARVFPVSTDVQVTGNGPPSFLGFVPSAGALAMTSEAIREYLGQWYYRSQGWN